jgi:hypothetical protein
MPALGIATLLPGSFQKERFPFCHPHLGVFSNNPAGRVTPTGREAL